MVLSGIYSVVTLSDCHDTLLHKKLLVELKMKNRFYKLSHPDLFHESNYNIVAIAISRRQFEPPRSGNWVRLVVVDI